MQLLTEEEIILLNKIKSAIEGKAHIDSIKETCFEFSEKISDSLFVYTYAGILLASENRIKEAIQILKYNNNNVFTNSTAEYLKRNNSLITQDAYNDNTPYTAWLKTGICREHQNNTITAAVNFLKKYPPKSDSITFIDVGPGDGLLTEKLLHKLIPQFNIKKINLILIEPSEKMLKTTIKKVKSIKTAEIKTTSISNRLEKLSNDEIDIIKSEKPIWFAFCAASIHHVPLEIKSKLFLLLKSLTPICILDEFNFNCNIHEKKSPELIYSIYGDYGFIMEDTLCSPLSTIEKEKVIYDLLFAEISSYFINERLTRSDHHASIYEWKAAAKKGGYKVEDITATYYKKKTPFTFLMELSS